MFEFFKRLGDLFSNGDGSHYDTNGHESVIDVFDGSTMDTVEEYVCDYCDTRFRVVANVNFKTYEVDDKKKFSNTYVSPLHTKKISLFEG